MYQVSFLLLLGFTLCASNVLRSDNVIECEKFGPSYRHKDCKPSMSRSGGSHNWNYHLHHEGGPDEWANKYPDCGGRRQSPIDIISKELHNVTDLPPLEWVGYENEPDALYMENNGHSVMMTADYHPDRIPTLSGGPLGRKKYQFSQLHFHWGKNDKTGSEHKINGRSYPMEVHLVHARRNSKGEEDPNDLCVVGLVYKLSSVENKYLDVLWSSFPLIRDVNSRAQVPVAVPLVSFIREAFTKHDHYATYPGSLTTPPCSESVTWIVKGGPLHCGDIQLQRVRQQVEGLKYNHRPPQSLNGRTVRYC